MSELETMKLKSDIFLRMEEKLNNLQKVNAALLEAGKVLFEKTRHEYKCPSVTSDGVACNCGFQEAITKWVKAEGIAQAEGKS